MAQASLPDLSALPVGDAITTIDYESIVAATLDDLKARLAAVGVDFDLTGLETDPLVINEQARAYREVLVLTRINDCVRAVLLASSSGSNLDQLATDLNVERLEGESDADFRYRRQLAPEGLAIGGPEDAYRYHILTADPTLAEVKPLKGEDSKVTLVLLSKEGDGSVTSDQILLANETMSPTNRRPMTDTLMIRGADVMTAAVRLRLYIASGPDATMIKDAALAGLNSHLASRRKIGVPVYVDGLIGAAREAKSVERVEVLEPAATLDPGETGVVVIDSVKVEVIRV